MKQQGSATIEFVVVALTAIPLFLVVPLLGKQLDAKHQTNMAARYAAWERTIWSDLGNGWRNDETAKSDFHIKQEVNDRFFGHRQAKVVDVGRSLSDGITDEPLWKDRKGQNLIKFNAAGQLVDSQISENKKIKTPGVVANMLAGSGAELFGVSMKTIGLNLANFVKAKVNMEWAAEYPGERLIRTEQSSGSAILSDAWSSSSESVFRRRVDGLKVDDELSVVVNPGTYLFGALFPFREGRKGSNPKMNVSSSVVPNKFYEDGKNRSYSWLRLNAYSENHNKGSWFLFYGN